MSESTKNKISCSKCGAIHIYYGNNNTWISCRHIISYDEHGNAVRCDYPFGMIYTGKKEKKMSEGFKPSDEVVPTKKPRKKRVEKGPRKCKVCGVTGHNAQTCPTKKATE